MIEVSALAYGMLASFVVASFKRNRAARRRDPAILSLFGWMLLSFSGLMAVMMLGYAGISAAGVLGT